MKVPRSRGEAVNPLEANLHAYPTYVVYMQSTDV